MNTPLTAGPLDGIYDVLDFLSGVREHDEDRVWSRVAEKLAVALDAEAASYFIYLPKRRQLLARYALGVAAQKLPGTPIEIESGFCGWVAKHREPLNVADAYQDPRFLNKVDELTGFTTKSVLAVPLIEGMDLTGVLEVVNKRGGAFTQDDLRFAVAACRMAAIALHALRLETMVDKVTAHNASILENLGGGFLASDMHGRLILCNPAARRILSLPEAPLNVPLEEALKTAPQLAEILLKTVATRQTVKRQEVQWTFGGKTRVLGYTTIMIQDPQGNVAGAGITFQDITGVAR